MNKTVAVGMSGGVDSSVAVHLLKEAGYQVIGVHMLLHDDGSSLAAREAENVAKRLEVPFYTVDLRRAFRQEVIEPFIREYLAGRTPNPCVRCNQQIKFGYLADFARQIGADFIATGHYAQIERRGENVYLKRGQDERKDQSYFLCQIRREMLSRVLFPLGHLNKDATRRLAAACQLEAAQKPESQEICFIPDNDYKNFLLKQSGQTHFAAGDFINESGQKLGTHQGIPCYTIGQRKGLGIALGYPAYVTAIDVENNTVTLGTEEALLHDHLQADNLNYLVDLPTGKPLSVLAKIRYRAQREPATLTISGQWAEVAFARPQRAITPGQTVCFYHGDYVLGGGKILRAWSD